MQEDARIVHSQGNRCFNVGKVFHRESFAVSQAGEHRYIVNADGNDQVGNARAHNGDDRQSYNDAREAEHYIHQAHNRILKPFLPGCHNTQGDSCSGSK
ncbi:MAG: hypothetical protein JW384_04037 [Nitrosomonadaceae bacterium]|nr:hypothetical protein [Nitrosomonadaceae bacterium]